MFVKYDCYAAIINKCDKISAYLYLAKHISLIMLLICTEIIHIHVNSTLNSNFKALNIIYRQKCLFH